MKTAVFIAALVAGVTAAPQAVTANVAPQEQTPAGCSTNYNGVFQITPQAIGNKKRGVQKRQSTPLEVTLKDGVLLDAQKRTGYIASNNQFQFDGPAQAGAIYTAGWSVCQNGSLALGNSAVFYQCLSGSFYNLYDENTAAQCSPVYLLALGSSSPTGTGAAAKNAASVTAGAHTIICQIGDGQIQHDTCVTTATPVAEATDGQITGPKVTGPAITQIGDGQVQAPGPSGAPSAPAVTAPAAGTPAVQAPRVSQISDGQIQAPTNGTAIISRTPTVSQPATTAAATPATSFTGAAVAPTLRAELYGLVAGVVALAML